MVYSPSWNVLVDYKDYCHASASIVTPPSPSSHNNQQSDTAVMSPLGYAVITHRAIVTLVYYGHLGTNHKCPDNQGVLIFQVSLYDKVLFVKPPYHIAPTFHGLKFS